MGARLHRVGLAITATVLVAVPAAAPAGATGATGDATTRLERGAGGNVMRATIRRTRYGVPHIRARNFASMGFGVAYAFAEDNICTIADSYVTVNAQRSRYFGPDESWVFSGNGARYNNLSSDFYFQSIKKRKLVEKLVRSKPPSGPSRLVRKGVRGYVAGYNAYLRDTGVDNLPDERCRGAEWVRPIREIDAYRRFFQLGILASSGAAIDGIADAAPALGAAAIAAAEQEQTAALDSVLSGEAEEFFPLESGSNAYGLGAEATRGPWKGLVLGNPHFPWDGAERLYQMHLTVPGKVDVAGAGLYGVPLVLIGHTRGLAWSHTVASAWRFTPFQLVINPLDPHQYLVDGEFVDMDEVPVKVKVKTETGFETQSRTLYTTRYGPMFTSLLGLPLFPWTPVAAFALGDVNEGNFRYLNHFARVNQAQTVKQLDRIEQRVQGIPWVNTIAADRRGNAYYTMDGAIPNVPDSKATGCAGAMGPALFAATGIPVLDGSNSACAWDDDPDAVAPGIFGPARIPRLTVRSYVHNGNDSHWVSNPDHPLEGFERIIGVEDTERSYRTRVGLVMAQQRIAGTDGRKGKGFTLRNLSRVALGNRQYLGELWRDQAVGVCEGSPSLVSAGACTALEGWNRRDNLGSNGALLFRRFAVNLLGNFQFLPDGTSSGYYVGGEAMWTTPFSPADPVNTPNGLNTSSPLVEQALSDAVADLQGAGVPMDAPLRGYQYEIRGGKKIPIHGGSGGLGVFNAISASWRPGEGGYTNIGHGTSFIAAMGFKKTSRSTTRGPRKLGGCPARALTFVTYGQTEDQASPHADDYTRAFSRKRWNRVPFCAREVRRATLSVERVANRRGGR